MWQKQLDDNRFISQIYNEVPELIDIRILSTKLEDEGRKFSIVFVMPKYADNPPKKWKNSGYNSVLVELNFYDIKELSITASNKKLSGDIKIDLDQTNLLNISVSGTLDLSIKADVGIIQTIKGYIDTKGDTMNQV